MDIKNERSENQLKKIDFAEVWHTSSRWSEASTFEIARHIFATEAKTLMSRHIGRTFKDICSDTRATLHSSYDNFADKNDENLSQNHFPLSKIQFVRNNQFSL